MKVKKGLAALMSVCMVSAGVMGCSTDNSGGTAAAAATTAAPAADTTAAAGQDTEAAAGQTPAAQEPAGGDELVIGVTLQNLSEEFIAMLKGSIELKQKADYPNIRLIINDAESKPDKQAAQLDSFIAQKVDAVIINPCDAEALIPGVKAVVDAGIPCITLSSDVSQDVGQVWVGSANFDGGQLAAEYAREISGGEADVAVLRLMLGAFAEIGRQEGYEAVINDTPGMNIVFDQSGNAQREEGMAIMENWLATGKNIDVVLAQNDGMALGAIEAIKAAGRMDEIKVIGIDAIKDALDSVKAGEMAATCFQDAIGQGEGALEMAVKAAKGEKIERNNIPFELVTDANADEYYGRIKLPD